MNARNHATGKKGPVVAGVEPVDGKDAAGSVAGVNAAERHHAVRIARDNLFVISRKRAISKGSAGI